MQQKTVIVNGEKMGIVIHNGRPIMTCNMIATAFGITPKKASNVHSHYKKLIQDGDSYLIQKAEAKTIGFDVKGAHNFRLRLFTKKAIYAIQYHLEKASSPEVFTSVMEDYFVAAEEWICSKESDDYFEKYCDSTIGADFKVDPFAKKTLADIDGFAEAIQRNFNPPKEEDDEVLELAMKIVADRKKTKHFESRLRHMEAAANYYKAALCKIHVIIQGMEFQI